MQQQHFSSPEVGSRPSSFVETRRFASFSMSSAAVKLHVQATAKAAAAAATTTTAPISTSSEDSDAHHDSATSTSPPRSGRDLTISTARVSPLSSQGDVSSPSLSPTSQASTSSIANKFAGLEADKRLDLYKEAIAGSVYLATGSMKQELLVSPRLCVMKPKCRSLLPTVAYYCVFAAC